MGTTGDAITAGGGVRIQWTVTIEGFPQILTNGPTLPALDAWSGTGYTGALGGLALQWSDGQTIKPWSKELSVQAVRLAVQPDPDDTFGRAVFASSGGIATKLRISMSVTSDSAIVQSTADFPDEGFICIGTETMHYASKSASGFDGLTRGLFGPFDMPRLHTVPQFEDSAQIRPVVSSVPRLWIGREIRIYAHRVVSGILDAYTEAELMFCGRITSTADDATGLTWVEADDIRCAVKDAMLLRQQWSAQLNDGLYLRKGLKFQIDEGIAPAVFHSAQPLTVIGLPPSPTDHTKIIAGVYTFDELCIAIQRWIDGERAAGRAGMRYSFGLGSDPNSSAPRAQVDVSPGADTSSTDRGVSFTFPDVVIKFLGFGTEKPIHRTWNGTHYSFQGSEVPYRRMFLNMYGDVGDIVVPFTSPVGTFMQNLEWLPSSLRPPKPTLGKIGVVQLDTGEMMLVQFTTGTYVTPLRVGGLLDQLSGIKFDWDPMLSQRIDTAGSVSMRQVMVLNGPLHTIAMGLLASTGDVGANGPNDIFPAQLGAAIPNDVIADLDDDLRSLSASSDSLFLVLEKPTKLWTAIGCEFLLRAASLVWKSGQLRAATWSTPTESSGVHNFTESTKAEPATVSGATHRTTAREDDAFVVNVVKIQYNRQLKGTSDTYDSTLTIADVSAMDESGQHPITIQARNAYSGVAATTASLQNMATYIAGFMPLFSRPLRVLRRSIALPHFLGVAPGDHVNLSDANVRDPATGARGVTMKPGLVIGHRVDWGGFEYGSTDPRPLVGEVDLLLFPRSRSATYSPAAEVNQAAAGGGYNAGTKVLTFLPYEHESLSRDLDHFDVGDVVRIIEVDPVDPAAPLTWIDTLAAVNVAGNTVTLTTGLAGFVSTKFYRMIAHRYSLAAPTQRIHTFQADDATGTIEGLSEPNEYGWFPGNGRASDVDDVTTAQVELGAAPAFVAFDGAPLDTGYERSLARLVNSCVSHRTAPSFPSLTSSVGSGGADAAVLRRLILVERIIVGVGGLMSFDRKVWVRPFFRSSNGASVTLRVSLCREYPIGLSNKIEDEEAPGYVLVGPFDTATYTTSSTAWQHGSAHAFSCEILDGEGTAWLVYEGTPRTETRGSSMARVGAFLDGDS